jgi:hypothetical protein
MTRKQLQFSTRGTYIAPECNALEIKSQGIICQSTGETSIPAWGEGTDFPIEF